MTSLVRLCFSLPQIVALFLLFTCILSQDDRHHVAEDDEYAMVKVKQGFSVCSPTDISCKNQPDDQHEHHRHNDHHGYHHHHEDGYGNDNPDHNHIHGDEISSLHDGHHHSDGENIGKHSCAHDHHNHKHPDHHQDHGHPEDLHDHKHHEDIHAHLDFLHQGDGSTKINAWYHALRSTFLITIGGNAAILLFLYFKLGDNFINNMVVFAVGGLLGDVFLHLLPHAMEASLNKNIKDRIAHSDSENIGHNHEHDHQHAMGLEVGLSVLFGIFIFFLIENALIFYSSNGVHKHSHSEIGNKQQENEPEKTLFQKVMQPSAILNLVADAVHNFTDGMAIAAAYTSSSSASKAQTIGGIMSLAIVLHEIPHEIGDFAVLLAQGISGKQAFMLQFISAIGAFAGCIFGLVLSEYMNQHSGGNNTMILGATAGGFIYVSMVDILPDLISKIKKQEYRILNTLSQSFWFLLGVAFMLLIAVYEPHLH